MRIQQHLPVFFLFIIQLFDFLPGELGIAEVSVTRRLGIDRLAQIEFFQDVAYLEVEIVSDDLQQLLIALHSGAECIYAQGDRIALADGISNLHLTAFSQPVGHDVLRDITAIVCGAAVYFGRVLGREAAAADAAHAAISIADDLASGRAGIAEASVHDKASAGVDQKPRALIDQLEPACIHRSHCRHSRT